MNVRYEYKPKMTLIGFSTTIRVEEGYTKCPEFWNREYTQRYAHLWRSPAPQTQVEQAILDNGIDMSAICDKSAGAFE